MDHLESQRSSRTWQTFVITNEEASVQGVNETVTWTEKQKVRSQLVLKFNAKHSEHQTHP